LRCLGGSFGGGFMIRRDREAARPENSALRGGGGKKAVGLGLPRPRVAA